MIKKVLVVGYGEIGQSIAKVDEEAGLSVEKLDPPRGIEPSPDLNSVDLMHVCFPIFPTFWEEVGKNIEKYHPRIVILNSTIPMSMPSFSLDKVDIIIHAPVRGTHPNIIPGLRKYPTLVGPLKPLSDSDKTELNEYYKQANIEIIYLTSNKESSLAKIINTTWYALQIAFANQIDMICEKEGINFDEAYIPVMETDEIGRKYMYNEQGRAGAKEMIPRPVMIPGPMGGHCLMPNLKKLRSFAPEMVDWIIQTHDYEEKKRSKIDL